jgi:DNA repair exonuclease SbcCD ATPase subunit
LKYEDVKLASAAEVVAFMENITGLTGAEKEQAVFVDQGAAGAALKLRSAEQAKFFERLGGAEVCAKAKAYAVKRLSTISVVDRMDDIREYQTRLELSDKEMGELATNLAGARAAVDGVTRADFERVVHSYEAAQARVKANATLQATLDALHGSRLHCAAELTKAQMALTTTEAALAERKQGYEQARLDMAAAEQSAKILAERNRVFAQIEALNAEVAQHPAPTPPEAFDMAQAEANLSGWSSTLAESKKFLDIFGSTGKCPTCGTEVQDSEKLIAHHRSVVEMYDPAVQQVRAQIQAHRLAASGYETAVASYNSWADGWNKRSTGFQASLAGLPEVGAQQDTGALQAVVAEYASLERNYREAQALEARTTKQLADIDARLAAAQAGASTDAEVPPTAEAYAAAQAGVAAYDEMVKTAATLEGQLAAKVTERERNQKVLDGLILEQQRNEANVRAKNLLEGLKTIFHQDLIPRDRVRSYVERLNKRISAYSARLNAPFSLFVTTEGEDMRPMAQFSNRVEPVFQLSGGQFMLAAWSWHLGLYEEHASNVGFVVMDEPTVALDTANIRNVMEVVEYLNLHCAAAGLQFIMVTHEADIASAFSNKVQISSN